MKCEWAEDYSAIPLLPKAAPRFLAESNATLVGSNWPFNTPRNNARSAKRLARMDRHRCTPMHGHAYCLRTGVPRRTIKVMLQAATEEGDARRVSGRPWVKGQSGNPNGRRGERKFKGKTLAELARSMTHEALETVRLVMHDETASLALRLQAADIVLRRGWGDAPKKVEDAQSPFTYVIQHLSVDSTPVPGVINSGLPPRISPSTEAVAQTQPI